MAGCNAVVVRSSHRLGGVDVRTHDYLLIIAAYMFLFAC